MRILIAVVGRARHGPERALYDHFAARIAPAPELREVEEKKPLEPAERRRREGERLLAQIPEGAFIVALDEAGQTLSSRLFADHLQAALDDGRRDLAFIIGGADGLDGAVRKAADLILAFGPQTWPHMLVRGMLAEQLYRAQSILQGHPYHRD